MAGCCIIDHSIIETELLGIRNALVSHNKDESFIASLFFSPLFLIFNFQRALHSCMIFVIVVMLHDSFSL